MQFNKFLNENSNQILLKDFKSIIVEKCKVSYERFKNGYNLYRGVKFPIGNCFEIIPRIDRKPLNTPYVISNILDEYFLEKFGWKARSEGVFCSGDDQIAAKYGDIYTIFPVDPFEFIWSPFVNDMYKRLVNMLQGMYYPNNTKFYNFELEKNLTFDELKNFLFEFLDTVKYSNKKLQSAILSGNEIMIKCNKYYGIKFKYVEDILQ